MGTIPTISTFAAGPVITATQMNSVKAAVDFWANPPRCYAYRNGAASLANYTTTWTAIDLDAEVDEYVQSGDTQSHDNTTNPSRVFIRTSGKYEISGAIEYNTNATGYRSAMVRKNSAGVDTAGTLIVTNTQGAVNGAITSVPLPVVYQSFTAGDHIELFGRQTSGGSLGLGPGSAQTFLRMRLFAA